MTEEFPEHIKGILVRMEGGGYKSITMQIMVFGNNRLEMENSAMLSASDWAEDSPRVAIEVIPDYIVNSTATMGQRPPNGEKFVASITVAITDIPEPIEGDIESSER